MSDVTRRMLLFPLLALARSALGELQCWFPSGELMPSNNSDNHLPFNTTNNYADNDRPCYPDRPTSFCCGIGEICSSNKLCIGGPGTGYMPYNRGTCTDRTWQSPECPQFCRSSSTLQLCGPDLYCCPDNNTNLFCNCGQPEKLFSLPNGTIFGTINPRTSSKSISKSGPLSHSNHVPDSVWGALGAVASFLSLFLGLAVWRWQIHRARARTRDNYTVTSSTQTEPKLLKMSADLERYLKGFWEVKGTLY